MSSFVNFTDEEIYLAAHADIKSFLEGRGEIVSPSGTEWKWDRHDSLKFRGHVWYQHSTGEKGTAIDLLCQFFNMSFPAAVKTLLAEQGRTPKNDIKGEIEEIYRPNKPLKQKKKLVTPPRCQSSSRLFAYLIQTRKLDRRVVSFFMKQGLLYESSDYHNVVFVGKDKQDVVRHCALKGTLTGRPYTADVDGSDKSFSFHYIGTSNTVYIFEAAIDLMSYITLYLLDDPKWTRRSYITTDGLTMLPIDQVLCDYSHIQRLVFCYDNDRDARNKDGTPAPNRGQVAAQKHAQIYAAKGYRTKIETPVLKDWNEILQEERKCQKG